MRSASIPWRRWPAAQLAEKEGVKLGFEPEDSTYSGSPQEVARIVAAIGSANVGVAWDTNNGWSAASMDDAYALFKGRVVNVHVKERPLTPDDERILLRETGRAVRRPALLGTGAIPWPDLIRTLRRGGYRGVYSIETHIGHGGRYGAEKLKAATTFYMYALRELLEDAEASLAGTPSLDAVTAA